MNRGARAAHLAVLAVPPHLGAHIHSRVGSRQLARQDVRVQLPEPRPRLRPTIEGRGWVECRSCVICCQAQTNIGVWGGRGWGLGFVSDSMHLHF